MATSLLTKELNRALKAANNRLSDLSSHNRDTYYSAIPLDRIYDAVEEPGFVIDPDEKTCILCGRDGKADWDLFFGGRACQYVLHLTWHKMDASGRYEVLAYVS